MCKYDENLCKFYLQLAQEDKIYDDYIMYEICLVEDEYYELDENYWTEMSYRKYVDGVLDTKMTEYEAYLNLD